MTYYALPPLATMLATPALVAAVADRVYALRAPPDVQPPYVTWVPVAAEEVPVLGPPQGDLARTRVQVDVWARSYAQAAHIAGLVRDALTAHGVVTTARALDDPDTDLARVVIEAEMVQQ